MLSVFPSLFTYELAVPFVFRIVIGLTFVVYGYKHIAETRDDKVALLVHVKPRTASFWLWCVGIVNIVGGLLLVIGLYTQVVALVFSILLLWAVMYKYRKPELVPLSQATLLLLLLVTASLLFLGPGFYAIDLPL